MPLAWGRVYIGKRMERYVSKRIGREGVAVLEPGFALIRQPG